MGILVWGQWHHIKTNLTENTIITDNKSKMWLSLTKIKSTNPSLHQHPTLNVQSKLWLSHRGQIYQSKTSPYHLVQQSAHTQLKTLRSIVWGSDPWVSLHISNKVWLKNLKERKWRGLIVRGLYVTAHQTPFSLCLPLKDCGFSPSLFSWSPQLNKKKVENVLEIFNGQV